MTNNLLSRLRAGVSPSMAAAVLATLSFGAVATAVGLQLALDYYPCPWCILQRYAFLGAGCLLLARATTGNKRVACGLNVAAGLVVLLGAAMAAFQLYVKLVPSASCGRDKVADFVNGLAPASVLPTLFEATGSCVDPIPVNFPLLSLAGFAAIGLGAALFIRVRRII